MRMGPDNLDPRTVCLRRSGKAQHLAGHWRILRHSSRPVQIAAADAGPVRAVRPVERLLAVLEHLQFPLAQVREHLAPGMARSLRNNFREQGADKTVLRSGGRRPVAPRHKLPVAPLTRSRMPTVGFRSSQPPAGGRGQEHLPARRPRDLRALVSIPSAHADRPAQIDEFLTVERGSYDSVMSTSGRPGTRSRTTFRPALGSAQPVDSVVGYFCAARSEHWRALVRRHQAGRAAFA